MSAAYLTSDPLATPLSKIRGCTNKIQFFARSEAARSAKSNHLLHPRPYKCCHCGMWHLTSKDFVSRFGKRKGVVR